jgi:hypothetical protein
MLALAAVQRAVSVGLVLGDCSCESHMKCDGPVPALAMRKDEWAHTVGCMVGVAGLW